MTLDGGSTVKLDLLNGGTGVRRTDADQVDLTAATLLSTLNQGAGVRRVDGGDFRITLTDGTTFDVDVTAATTTLQHVLDAIQAGAPGRLSAVIDPDTLNSLLLTDALDGGGRLTVTPLNSSAAAFDLGILRDGAGTVLIGLAISDVSVDLRVTLSDGSLVEFDLSGLTTLADVLAMLNLEHLHFAATGQRRRNGTHPDRHVGWRRCVQGGLAQRLLCGDRPGYRPRREWAARSRARQSSPARCASTAGSTTTS